MVIMLLYMKYNYVDLKNTCMSCVDNYTIKEIMMLCMSYNGVNALIYEIRTCRCNNRVIMYFKHI